MDIVLVVRRSFLQTPPGSDPTQTRSHPQGATINQALRTSCWKPCANQSSRRSIIVGVTILPLPLFCSSRLQSLFELRLQLGRKPVPWGATAHVFRLAPVGYSAALIGEK